RIRSRGARAGAGRRRLLRRPRARRVAGACRAEREGDREGEREESPRTGTRRPQGARKLAGRAGTLPSPRAAAGASARRSRTPGTHCRAMGRRVGIALLVAWWASAGGAAAAEAPAHAPARDPLLATAPLPASAAR